MILKPVLVFSFFIIFGLTFEVHNLRAAEQPLEVQKMRKPYPLITLKDKGSLTSAVLSSDNRYVATVTGGVLTLWDAQSGQQIKSSEIYWRGCGVYTSAFNNDGQQLLTIPDGGNKVLIFNAQADKIIAAIKPPYGNVLSATFAPQGYVAIGSASGIVSLWNINDKELLKTFDCGNNFEAEHIALTSDGRWLAVASRNNSSVIIWDIPTHHRAHYLEHPNSNIKSANFSNDGRFVITSSWYHIYKWDTHTGKLIFSLRDSNALIESAAFSPDGRFIITASDEAANIRDACTGKLIDSLKGHKFNSANFSSDGKRIITASKDGTVIISMIPDPSEAQIFCPICNENQNVQLADEDNALLSQLAQSIEEDLFQEFVSSLKKHKPNSVACITDPKRVITSSKDGAAILRSIPEPSTSQPAQISCPICMEKKYKNEFVSLCTCHHTYCKDCLLGMLNTAIRENVVLQCPEPYCRAPFTERDWYTITNDRTILETLENRKTEEWIRQHGKFCPTPGCSFAFEPYQEREIIQCPQCHATYCSNCLINHHLDVSCAEAIALRLSSDHPELESENWIFNNTKQCPHCHYQIEKNGGCLHMTCRYCHYQFCWNCLEQWPCHGSRGSYECRSAARDQLPQQNHRGRCTIL